jgi:hypothetical protein
MKQRYFYILVITAAFAFLAFGTVKLQDEKNGGGRNDKIIKFSHKNHADRTDCASCHTKTAESTSLKDKLLPQHPDCAQCHDVEDTNGCNLCHYENNFEPLIQRKSELIFNHKYHLTDQKLKCEDCHKGLNEVDYSFQAEQHNPPMEQCNTCHSFTSGTAGNECVLCHTSTVDLKPDFHKQNDFIKAHRFYAENSDANCSMCHDNASCEDCHIANSVITETNTAKDFYAPYAPHNFGESAKKQKLNLVHQDLNYRYDHGIDARNKSAECQTCHQTETFCVECHQSEGGDFALLGTKPADHKQPNFVTIGVGTGGGEHAVLARRDIESCASCHDSEGNDPVCITCHLDSDGIKGTNPKTHPANFMHDEHGDWHDSNGSLCYNCHTSASPSTPSGVGFCGYCHGKKNNR